MMSNRKNDNAVRIGTVDNGKGKIFNENTPRAL
jgi:hypothetical protein